MVVEQCILIIVVVIRTLVVNSWVVNSLASRRAEVINRMADSDLGNYSINMVGQVRRINSVIAELVSPCDLQEHQTIEVIHIVRVIRIIILMENQTIEVIHIVRAIRIIIVTFTFISFKIN